jgi:diguanylate cyclase
MGSPSQPADSDEALAEAVLSDLRASGRLADPRHFAFWFAYRSGRNCALNVVADEIIAKRGRLTDEDIDGLYDRFLSAWRMSDGPEALTGRLAMQLSEVSSALEQAIGSSVAQRETLMAEACELNVVPSMTLCRVIETVDRLMRSAREAQIRRAFLAAKLQTTSREIGALRQQLAVVQAESQTDPLTNLPLRGAFRRSLDDALRHADDTNEPLAVMLCDIDYFGSFTDNFGQQLSNELVRATGLLLKFHLRPTDTVARFDDDEFAVAIANTTIAEVTQLAEKFRQTLMRNELVKVPIEKGSGRVTVSIGLATLVKGDTAQMLLDRAAAGLKVAKTEGRNRVVEMRADGPVWTAARVA